MLCIGTTGLIRLSALWSLIDLCGELSSSHEPLWWLGTVNLTSDSLLLSPASVTGDNFRPLIDAVELADFSCDRPILAISFLDPPSKVLLPNWPRVELFWAFFLINFTFSSILNWSISLYGAPEIKFLPRIWFWTFWSLQCWLISFLFSFLEFVWDDLWNGKSFWRLFDPPVSSRTTWSSTGLGGFLKLSFVIVKIKLTPLVFESPLISVLNLHWDLISNGICFSFKFAFHHWFQLGYVDQSLVSSVQLALIKHDANLHVPKIDEVLLIFSFIIWI